MAISHVCLSCGLDLARVRARLDPHYALPIVVCPDCGWAAVRRKTRAWRSFHRLIVGLLALAVQVGLAVGGLAGLFFLSDELGHMIVRGSFSTLPREEIFFRLAIWASFAVGLGAWLTAGFGHTRPTTAWLVFWGAGIALVAVGSLVEGRLDQLVVRCMVASIIMTTAVAGVPFGMLARLGWRQVTRAGWRSHRRRLRLRSMGR